MATYTVVPDKNRKKPNRLSATQKQSRRENESCESRVLNLTLDINQLRQEVLYLMGRRDLQITRLLLDRERREINMLNAANSVLYGTGSEISFAPTVEAHNFSGSLVGPWGSASPSGIFEFVLQLDQPGISQRHKVSGTTQVLAFVEEDLGNDTDEAAELRRICGHPGGCVVEATGSLVGRFSYEAIISTFPHAQETNLALIVSRMVGLCITCPARLMLYFNVRHQIVQQVAQIEVSAVLNGICEARPTEFAAVERGQNFLLAK